MKVSSNQQYNQKFEAKLISQWKCTNRKGSSRNVSILELEQLDVEYFKNFRWTFLSSFFKNGKINLR